MGKDIEKIMEKKELERLSDLDRVQTRRLVPDNLIKTNKEKNKSDKLLRLYRVKEKTKISSLILSKDKKSIDQDLQIFDSDSTSSDSNDAHFDTFFKASGLDYGILKDDIARLTSYEDLAKQYKLTQSQLENVGEIYSRIKEAEGSALNLSDGYQQMTDKVKEMADISKRIVDEISGGDYIREISHYRSTM